MARSPEPRQEGLARDAKDFGRRQMKGDRVADQQAALAAIQNEIERIGLDAAEIARHAAAVQDAVIRRNRPQFEIVDTCRLANGGVLPADFLAEVTANGQVASGFVAFVPAAGAASRYSQPLFEIVQALEAPQSAESDTTLAASLVRLRNEGARAWPLPQRVKLLLDAPETIKTLTAADRQALLMELQLPKALLPCVADGVSFLTMKQREHASLPGLAGEAYVAPVGMADAFAAAATLRPTPLVLEQGAKLSTLRFTPAGAPVMEANGRLSTVPAGHGALAQLFPAIGTAFPAAHSLFIRNIDNVMGTGAAAVAATTRFMGVHATVLDHVRRIRSSLGAGKLAAAAEIAQALLVRCTPAATATPLTAAAEQHLAAVQDPALRTLSQLQLRLFHANPRALASAGAGPALTAALTALYARPVNTMGQVPNTGKDVGGTACFVRTTAGIEKLCLEVPHASPADKRDFLEDPAKATHFNPVFVAAEITTDPAYYARRNEEFWLLSEKTYRGNPVLYYETVLYELLGNSRLANCIFIEVPRLVFHPHKTLKDACDRTASYWLG